MNTSQELARKIKEVKGIKRDIYFLGDIAYREDLLERLEALLVGMQDALLKEVLKEADEDK